MKKFNYYVTESTEHDEWFELKTNDIEEARAALERCYNYSTESERKNRTFEIRSYKENIEDDDCDCWDYDVIESK